MTTSPNFGFLDEHLAMYAIRAEQYVFDDTNTCLVKLRQFAERLARDVAARHGIETFADDFHQTISILRKRRLIPSIIRDHIDLLRLKGNEAAHEGKADQQLKTDRTEALQSLIAAREIAIWFHRTFYDAARGFGPFRPPPNPVNIEAELREELESLRNAAATYQVDLAYSQGKIESLEESKHKLEETAQRYHTEIKHLSDQQDADRREYEEQLCNLREAAERKTPTELDSFIERSNAAAQSIGLVGEQSEHIPLTQIRIPAKCPSWCHKATQLLAQESESGFVKGYCTECGKKIMLSRKDFAELDLWVVCPKGHGRTRDTCVTDVDGRNVYGYECLTCGWRCKLATLLPRVRKIGIWNITQFF